MLATDLQTFLDEHEGLEGLRLYPGPLPPEVEFPAIAYKLGPLQERVTHSGPDGLPRAEIELACGADSRAEADELARRVLAALNGLRGPMGEGTCLGAFLRLGEPDSQADLGIYWRLVNGVIYYRE